MLQTQLERGNNGLIKTKFLTFTIEAKDIKSARARLARIETDTLNHFKVIGAAARAYLSFRISSSITSFGNFVISIKRSIGKLVVDSKLRKISIFADISPF